MRIMSYCLRFVLPSSVFGIEGSVQWRFEWACPGQRLWSCNKEPGLFTPSSGVRVSFIPGISCSCRWFLMAVNAMTRALFLRLIAQSIAAARS